eukprot:1192301-Prymnesium_polylepis.1
MSCAPLKFARTTRSRSEAFPRYRAPQNVTTRMRARASTERTIGRPPGTDVYDRSAARALGGSMHGTQGVHPGRGRAAGEPALASTEALCANNVGFCTNYSRNEPVQRQTAETPSER